MPPPEAELAAEVEAVMRTAEETLGPLTGGVHLRVGWPSRHVKQPREMKCGCELHALLSQVPQGFQPSQGSSSGHRALSTPWQPEVQILVISFHYTCETVPLTFQ